MVNEVSKQMQNINDALAWIKANRPNDYKAKFINLVRQRRNLRIIARAASDNPAIAAFGKSQVGKSYLMSCVLQKRNEKGVVTPFKIHCNGKEYDFIKEVNPIGDGKEATGVVTRFSSYKRNKESYDKDYPVMVRCLSVSDIVLILCDTYFNDIHNYTTSSEQEIRQTCEELVSHYSVMPTLPSPAVTADDILGLKQYFNNHINNAQVFDNCSLFSELALIIERVPIYDYISVFKILWNSDENISRLFGSLMLILQKMRFHEYIYLPVNAVLHEGIKENTVMSVECLKHLLDADNNYRTDVYVKERSGMERVGTFTKSEVCAVAAEVVYRIDEDFIESTNQFCLDGISEAVKTQINREKITMSILKDNDLLDFPGARSREQEDCGKLKENSILLYCFLRGKVAYLFNKYNEALLINVLLYCHHNKDNDVTDLWHLLDEWVRTNVGETPEKRKSTLERTRISPLFYVATMFNLDLKYNDSEVENSTNAICARWKGRFDTVLNNQCFHRDSVEWVKNWCAKGDFFRNSYLLRDFKYSGPKESGLYEGFYERGEETSMIIPSGYFQTMRETFVRDVTVKELFRSPEMAWDLAATRNNDGSLYIIENLQTVASLLDKAREELLKERCHDVAKKVRDEIKDYYVSTDKNKILEANIRKAKSVFRELSFTCNIDNYYFGHLLQALQITEVAVYKMLHEQIMQNHDLINSPNEFVNYEIIRKDCENCGCPLDRCASVEEKWNALLMTYAFDNTDEATEYLQRRGVDSKRLFESKPVRQLKNSNVIADFVYNTWCEGLRSVDFMNTFTGENMFSSGVMVNFIDNMIETSKSVRLDEVLASAVSAFVDVVDIHVVNEELVADIMAGVINGFVLDLGYSFYDDAKMGAIRQNAEMYHLPIFNYVGCEMEPEYSEEYLTGLFNNLSSNPAALIPSFEEHYYKWIEYMYISFIANVDVRVFNIEANNELKVIIDKSACTFDRL